MGKSHTFKLDGKMHSRWVKGLSLKNETIKILEVGDCLYIWGWRKTLLNLTQDTKTGRKYC